MVAGPTPVPCYRCIECDELHEDKGTISEFFSVYGNITTGAGSGIVGNNLDDEGRVVNSKPKS